MHFSQTLYFLILATILAVVALATSNWKCGNIVVDCQGKTKSEKMLHLTAKSLLIVGVGLLVLAIIMEVVTCCLSDNTKKSPHTRSFAICRSVSSLLALCTLLAGILIVTHLIDDIYSYMAMVMAVGFVIHCNTLAIQTIKCSDN